MEYYFISFLISLFLFIIIQFFEYYKHLNEIKNNSDNYFIEPYTPFKLNNIFLFIIIYIVFTIICYFLNLSNLKSFDLFKFTGGNLFKSSSTTTINNDTKTEFDPKILSKINDNFKIGFEPFNSDTDIKSTDDDNSSDENSDEDSE